MYVCMYVCIYKIFPSELGQTAAVSPWVALLHLFRNTTGLFMSRMYLLQSSHQCQSTEGTQGTDPNQRPDLMHSSFTAGFLNEGELIPLHQLADAINNPSKQDTV